MYFLRTSIPEQSDDRTNCVASDNGIINQNYSFARDIFRERTELLSYPKLPKTIGWLDEGTTNVAIFAEYLRERQARLREGTKVKYINTQSEKSLQ